MNETQLKEWFARAGLRVKFSREERERRAYMDARFSRRPVIPVRDPVSYRFDVEEDKNGEFFLCELLSDEGTLELIDTVPSRRHLLLRNPADGSKLLLGHDERHLFISTVASNSRSVEDALVRLAPSSLENALRGQKKPHKNIWKRRTRRFERQGEWFFIPCTPQPVIAEADIVRNEPIQRNAQSKPHICEEMYRYGGTTTFIVIRDGKVLSLNQDEYKALIESASGKVTLSRTALEGARVFVRGKISHEDHSTLDLGTTWHVVELNREVAPRGVRWLD